MDRMDRTISEVRRNLRIIRQNYKTEPVLWLSGLLSCDPQYTAEQMCFVFNKNKWIKRCKSDRASTDQKHKRAGKR